MKLAAIGAALLSLAIAGSAQAQAEEGANPATAARNTGTPSGSRLLPNGQSADKVQAAKGTKAKAAKPASRNAAVKDTASAAAPHRYPTANKPPVATVGAIRSNNDGTVHKNAPIDQVAGAGG